MDDRTTLSGPALRWLMFQYSLEVGDSVTINMKRINGKHRIIVYKDGGKGDEKRPEHGCLFYLTCSIIYLSTLISTKTVLLTFSKVPFKF